MKLSHHAFNLIHYYLYHSHAALPVNGKDTVPNHFDIFYAISKFYLRHAHDVYEVRFFNLETTLQVNALLATGNHEVEIKREIMELTYIIR